MRLFGSISQLLPPLFGGKRVKVGDGAPGEVVDEQAEAAEERLWLAKLAAGGRVEGAPSGGILLAVLHVPKPIPGRIVVTWLPKSTCSDGFG